MVQNTTFHNQINQEEHTPLVTILEVRTDLKQATAVDSRKSPYNVDLSKAAFGATYYPLPGSQWYLKKISGVWALMARAPRQNPQLDPAIVPHPGDVVLGGEGTTFITPPITAVTTTGADDAFEAKVAGNTVPRAAIRGDGSLWFSDGASAADTTVTRTGAGYLVTNATVQSTKAAVGNVAFVANVTGDVQSRVNIFNGGTVQWGDGTAAQDTNLYRAGVGSLKTDGDFTAAKGRFGGSSGAAVYVGDDGILVDVNTSNTIGIQGQQNAANGALAFGSGVDTNLYRGAANQLKTDDDFVAVGDVYTRGISVSTMNGLGVSGISASSTSASTAAGAESALNTTWSGGSNSMTFKNGFVYMFVFWYQLSDNINSSYSITIPRLYMSGGSPNIGGYVHYNGFNGHLGLDYTQVGYIKRIAGTNLTSGVGVTVQRYISGIAGTSNIDNAVVVIHELGLTSDHIGPASMAAAI